MYLKIYNLIINCFTKKYFQFKGRASRTEYNCFLLACWAIAIISELAIETFISSGDVQTIIGQFMLIYNLCTFFPFLSVTARRLHDFNWSFGFYIYLLLAVMILPLPLFILSVFNDWLNTLLGGVYIVCLSLVGFMPCFRKGNKEANRYGEPPEY